VDANPLFYVAPTKQAEAIYPTMALSYSVVRGADSGGVQAAVIINQQSGVGHFLSHKWTEECRQVNSSESTPPVAPPLLRRGPSREAGSRGDDEAQPMDNPSVYATEYQFAPDTTVARLTMESKIGQT